MIRIFISYRRADSSAYTGRLYDRLVAEFGKDNVFKDVDSIGIGDFRGAIAEAVNQSDVLLVIIGKQWAAIKDEHGNLRLHNPGDFVRLEIEAGLQRRGRCWIVPVTVGGAPFPDANQLPPDLRELSFQNAFVVRDDPDFHRDVDRLIDKLKWQFKDRYATGEIKPPQPQTSPGMRRPKQGNNKSLLLWGGGLLVVVAILIVIGIALSGGGNGDSTEMPTLSDVERLRTAEAESTNVSMARTAVAHATETAVSNIATNESARLTLIALSATPTHNATATLIAFRPATNDDWIPIEQVFDGVTMVLVPAGCFNMGENGEGGTQCFDEPFWIDKYEVTNEQYDVVSTDNYCTQYSSEPDQPRNCVDWFAASDFCESRAARLPTEAEWEYAARGVDSWVYPWGNAYDSSLVIGEDDPIYGDISTAPVGSRPEGVSWVGAMDMSGNVFEWVSSWYLDYPYEEGHEDDIDTYNYRVLRGGSFFNASVGMQSLGRSRGNPSVDYNYFGFRCARSY